MPLILTALPGQRWRVYVRPASEQGDLVDEATALLRRYMPAARFIDVENPSRFHCHTRVGRAFRAGPVFVAGDAAHVCSPAKGHGMNCGLQDAANLAWKLALVHHAVAAPALLDSYEQERRPVAEQLTRRSEAADQAQLLEGAGERDARDRTIAATLADPAACRQEAVAEAELNLSYAGSAITAGPGEPPFSAGQRLPTTIALPPGAGAAHLHQLTHRLGHTLLLLAGPQTDPAATAALRAQLEADTADSPLVELLESVRLEESSRLGLGPLTLLAVRPDGFIGLRADTDHRNELQRYRQLVLGR